MFCDLNVPLALALPNAASKKGKGKQPQGPSGTLYTPEQLATIDAKLDILVHLGYTVIAFNQVLVKKVDPKVHVNVLDPLLEQLKPRNGIVFLKRLTIVLDEDSEKGFGLINAHIPFFNSYDLLSLVPTTQATLSTACLTHSLPSQLTAHVISLPMTLPRPPFRLKHTLVRTAIKNGAVFEICYNGSIGGDSDTALIDAGAAENGPNAKRNWWAMAREIARVTKGKNLIVSSGAMNNSDLRAPRDVANLISLTGLPQDVANASLTKTSQSLILRASTRKTFRAVFSEPRVVIPEGSITEPPADAQVSSQRAEESVAASKKRPRDDDNQAGKAGGKDGHQGAGRKKAKKSKQEAR